MLKIGVTGGIGSGKTTVCKLFEFLKAPVYYADDEAKRLMQTDVKLIQSIKDLFGEQVYDDDNKLNRLALAEIVFNDSQALTKLNNIVHPAVAKHSYYWMENLAKSKSIPYAIKEAALIYETSGEQVLDYIIVVTAPKATRINRVMKRDRVPVQAVKARMEKQMSEEEKVKRADFLIHNDGKQQLTSQIWKLDRLFKSINQQIQHEL